MSEDIDPIQAKRQAALAKLRDRRGESGLPIFASRLEQEMDRLSLIIKAYQSFDSEGEAEADEETLLPPGDDEELPEHLEAHPDVPIIGGDAPAPAGEELPRIRKAREELADRDETARSAIAAWRSLAKSRRDRQLSTGTDVPTSTGPSQSERRQMFFDLLTVDFLESTRIWISANADSLDLSSTPPEEIERIYDQALYRRKVLDELGKLNEQEVDALTTYLRTVKVQDPSGH